MGRGQKSENGAGARAATLLKGSVADPKWDFFGPWLQSYFGNLFLGSLWPTTAATGTIWVPKRVPKVDPKLTKSKKIVFERPGLSKGIS